MAGIIPKCKIYHKGTQTLGSGPPNRPYRIKDWEMVAPSPYTFRAV